MNNIVSLAKFVFDLKQKAQSFFAERRCRRTALSGNPNSIETVISAV
jgi:hypothetical protein